MDEYLLAAGADWLFPTSPTDSPEPVMVPVVSGQPEGVLAVVGLRSPAPSEGLGRISDWSRVRARVLTGGRAPIGMVRLSSSAQQFYLVSRIRSHGATFTYVGQEQNCVSAEDQIRALRGLCARWAPRVVDELFQFRTFEEGIELETKQTVVSGPSPWALASRFLDLSESGGIPGHLPDLGNELQRWRYQQSTFELSDSRTAQSLGYVAFMRSTRGWAVKEKLFKEDGVRRLERVMPFDGKHPDEFAPYLRVTYPDATCRRLSDLERARFDVNVEASTSGHFFGIEIDDVLTVDGRRLRQVEVEYHKTRVSPIFSPDSVVPDLLRLTEFVQGELARIGGEYQADNQSKLTFLRGNDVGMPDLRTCVDGG